MGTRFIHSTVNHLRWAPTLAGLLVLTAGGASAVHYGKGPRPASTNAPGEVSCSAKKCHVQNELNSGGGALTVSGVPSVYEPLKRYTLTVTLQQEGQKRWGFQMTSLDRKDQPAGELSLEEDKLTQLKSQEMEDGSERYYVEHTGEGSFMGNKDGPVSWQLGWTAPPEAAGPIYFYTAANAANFNKKPWGDYIYTRIDTINAAEASQ